MSNKQHQIDVYELWLQRMINRISFNKYTSGLEENTDKYVDVELNMIKTACSAFGATFYNDSKHIKMKYEE